MISIKPKISVVIAVLNGADEIRTTLRSLETQDAECLKQIEILIADGGSSDATLEIARNSSLPVDIVSEPDKGIYDAMNKGAARAVGTWLHFLNAGDSFNGEGALRIVIDDLERAEQQGRSWFISGAKFAGGPADGYRIPNLPHNWRRHALGLQPHCHQATWFRSDLFAAIGGYSLDFDILGDFDLIVRWGVTGRPYTDHEILVDYQYGGISEQRTSEIPRLGRRVRQERLQLDPVAMSLDETLILASHVSARTQHLLRRVARYSHRLITSTLAGDAQTRRRRVDDFAGRGVATQ